MTRVILMCGPAGSGKTTLARQLEAEGFTRISVDEVAWRAGHRVHPLSDAAAGQIHAQMISELIALVVKEQDVVVDSSFWSRRSRDEYRGLLTAHGITPETFYLATPRDVVLRRVADRDNSGPGAIMLSHQTAESYFDGFEVPTPDEGPLRVIEF